MWQLSTSMQWYFFQGLVICSYLFWFWDIFIDRPVNFRFDFFLILKENQNIFLVICLLEICLMHQKCLELTQCQWVICTCSTVQEAVISCGKSGRWNRLLFCSIFFPSVFLFTAFKIIFPFRVQIWDIFSTGNPTYSACVQLTWLAVGDWW